MAYRESPLQTPFDRILQVGDAAGIQSPLSFGGFGALCRHLPRLETAISEALEQDLLTAEDLSHLDSPEKGNDQPDNITYLLVVLLV